METTETRFRNLVRGLLKLGIYPSPTAINTLRGKQGKENVLGGDHARWRREELEAAGFHRDPLRPTKRTKRVYRPSSNPIYKRAGTSHCRACGRIKVDVC